MFNLFQSDKMQMPLQVSYTNSLCLSFFMNEAQWLYLLTLAWQQKNIVLRIKETIPALCGKGHYRDKIIGYIF